MARPNHKQLVIMARRMQTDDEKYPGIFESKAWLKRKWQIRVRVHRQEQIAKAHAAYRRRNKLLERMPTIA